MGFKSVGRIKSLTQDLGKLVLTDEEIACIVHRYSLASTNKSKLCQNWSLHRNTVKRWVQRGAANLPFRPPKGHPANLSAASRKRIEQKALNQPKSGAGVNVADMHSTIVEEMAATAAERGQANLKTPGKRAIRRMKQQSQVKNKKADKGYKARLKAEFDTKSCISTITLFMSMLKFVGFIFLLINYDATQFIVSQLNKDANTVVVSVNDTRGPKDRPVKSDSSSGSHALDYAIKWFCLAVGGGMTNNDLVFLVADSALADDDFHVYEVPHLTKSMTAQGKNVGYVAFTKTRNGNQKFYKWFNKEHLLPFIKLLKDYMGVPDSFVFMFFDGEQVQNDVYFDEELLGLYSALKVILAKLAASCSAITQACDAWKIFSTLKHYIGTTTKDDANTNVMLKEALKAMIKEHEKKVGRPLKEDDKSRIVLGLLKIQRVIFLHFTPTKVVDSFKMIGFIENAGKLEVNVLQILNQFGQKLNLHEYTNLIANLDRACTLMRFYGTLTDAQMRSLFNVVVNREAATDRADSKKETDRDELSLVHQRCVILNHKAVVAREMKRLESRDDGKREKAEKGLMSAEDMTPADKLARKELQANNLKLKKQGEAEKRKLAKEAARAAKKQKVCK